MHLPGEISGHTRVYPILGDPIAQVHCPQLLNPRFLEAGIDAVMVPLHVPRGNLRECFSALKQIPNVGGMVITVPHKAEMATLIDVPSPRAARLGAVNIVRRNPDGSWVGDHFDGLGFVDSLRQRPVDPAGLHVFLAGCGGAGAAIADALAEAGAASLCLHDADPARTRAVAELLAAHYPGLLIETGIRESRPFDLLVNATPLGMRQDDPIPIPQTMLRPGRLVADIVMTPARTALLHRAEALGCEIHYGEPMLLAQMPRMVGFFVEPLSVAHPYL